MEETILKHKGLFSFSLIDNLLTQFKYVSQEKKIKFTTYKRILTVMIESLENVTKYGDIYADFVKDHPEYLPVFELTLNETKIYLKTQNPVRKVDQELLAERISWVNGKNKEELKALYVQTITNGKFSAKGGAGLGFIEMAKTSGNDLKFSFDSINDEFSLYTFNVTFAT